MNSTSDHAAAYLRRDFAPVPLKPRSKTPAGGEGWQNARYSADDLTAFENCGVGLLLGGPSGGLVDVDIDCPEALAAATLLPHTDMVSGRHSAPKSHHWYRCPDAPGKASTPFRDLDGSMIVELRSTGGQTMVAPSIHPCGEAVTWHADGEPVGLPAADLLRAVAKVAAVALLARHWPKKGTRQDAALALAGGLLRWGYSVPDAVVLVQAVADAAGDDEGRKRAESVARTAEKLRDGSPASGWPTLSTLMGRAGGAAVGRAAEWFLPKPAPGVSSAVVQGRYTPLPTPEPFPIDAMPAPWGEYAAEVGRVLLCDPSFAALPVLAALAGAVGNTRRIYLGGDWTEPAVVWVAIIGESGTRKSPAAEMATRFTRARQKRLHACYKAALAQYQTDAREYRRARGSARGGDETDDAAGEPPAPPKMGRVLVADLTIEKLSSLLDDNPRGLLCYRDELAGWLGSFCRYKGSAGGSDESNWLELHRAGQILYDRKTGEKTTVIVDDAAVSVCGGIQPGTLRRLLSQGMRESGLAARVIFTAPVRTPKTYVEEAIPQGLKDACERSIGRLYDLVAEADDDGGTRPVQVGLTAAAKACWKSFVNRWGVRQFESEGDRAAAEAKLEGYAARFALLHHLATAEVLEDTRPVQLASVEAGIRVAEWCAREAERVYQMLGQDDAETATRKLVELVDRLASRNRGRVTVKILQKSNNRKYRTRDAAEADLQRLVGMGLGRWEDAPPGERGGRPTRFYVPCTTHGESDDTDDDPDDGRPPPGDETSGPPAGARSDETSIDNSSGAGPNTCSESPPETDSFSSDSSCVVQGTSGDNGPAGGRGASGVSSTTCVVRRHGQLAEVAAAVRDSAAVGLDVETTGLDPRADRVRLVALATAAGTFLIDAFAVDPSPLWGPLAGAEVVGHNLLFDLRFLARLGFTPGRCHCTMLASQVLEAGDPAARHALEDAAARHLGLAVDKAEQLADWAGEITPEMARYAALDAELPLRLREAMAPKLAAAKLRATAALEDRCLPAMAWASNAGVGFDRAAWLALARDAGEDAVRLRRELDALCPGREGLFGNEGRNWDSPRQVAAAFGSLGVTLESTADEALALADHPAAAKLREYRGAAKRASAYGEAWLEYAAPDGRVYAGWRQNSTAAGRMSCASPNLQQLPRGDAYRRCFAAPAGRTLVKADYSQIELRLAAKIAGEPTMLAAYRRGDDLHALTARAILGKADVTKADRQLAKALNFGLLYGMGPKSLRVYAATSYGVTLTEARAKEYRDAFFAAYPGLRRWHARQGGGDKAPVATRTVLGRRRSGVTSYTRRLNSPVQGSGADGLKAALALLWERRSECPTAVPVLVVHDEIVVEVDDGEAEAATAWLVLAMTDGMRPFADPVPVAVEASVQRTWGG